MIEVLEKPGVRAAALKIEIPIYRQLFEGKKTELIQGVVVAKMSKSKLHAGVLDTLFHYLNGILPSDFRLSKEDPITLNDSEPEPDLAIVKPRRSIHDEHPTFAHLVVEVSVTTKALDEDKADMYAMGGIPLYWNILPVERVTVVYTNPGPQGYGSMKRVPFDQPLPVSLPGKTLVVNLDEILK